MELSWKQDLLIQKCDFRVKIDMRKCVCVCVFKGRFRDGVRRRTDRSRGMPPANQPCQQEPCDQLLHAHPHQGKNFILITLAMSEDLFI